MNDKQLWLEENPDGNSLIPNGTRGESIEKYLDWWPYYVEFENQEFQEIEDKYKRYEEDK